MPPVYTFIPFKQTCMYSRLVVYLYTVNGMYMELELKFSQTFSYFFYTFYLLASQCNECLLGFSFYPDVLYALLQVRATRNRDVFMW